MTFIYIYIYIFYLGSIFSIRRILLKTTDRDLELSSYTILFLSTKAMSQIRMMSV